MSGTHMAFIDCETGPLLEHAMVIVLSILYPYEALFGVHDATTAGSEGQVDAAQYSRFLEI